MEKYDWFNTSGEGRKEWETLCPVNEHRICSHENLPNIVPKGLTQKGDSIFVMASGDANGVTYWMANVMRVDRPDRAVDQNPFGVAFIGDDPAVSGCLVQHGDWAHRTTNPPEAFWDCIKDSGIGNHWPLSELPPDPSGSIDDLKVDSQKMAFGKIVDNLRQFTQQDDDNTK